jgi:hypothetical protein
MIMPRLSFEEPKGGPLAKSAQQAAPSEQQAEQPVEAEQLEDLFVEEPQDGPRHRKQPSRDTMLVILKGATVAVVLALVGVVILLATSGEGEPDASAPGVPQIETSDTPDDSGDPAAGKIVMPEVRSQTTELSVAPPPVTQPTLPTTEDPPPGPGNDDFVRVGEPCDTPGAYAFTESFDPVVCDRRGPNGRLAWHRMFR